MNPADEPALTAVTAESATSENQRWADERVTLEKLKTGDENAWQLVLVRLSRIAKEYVAQVFSGSQNTVTLEDAEEIASELATEIFQRIATVKSLDHLEAYFRTALKRDALDLKAQLAALKRGGGKVHSLGDPEILTGKKPLDDWYLQTNKALEDDGSLTLVSLIDITPADEVQNNELRRIIFDCAMSLALEERKMIGLVYLSKTHQEIAVAMKVGVSAVGSMLQRIYAKMRPKIIKRMGRKGLEDYGITID